MAGSILILQKPARNPQGAAVQPQQGIVQAEVLYRITQDQHCRQLERARTRRSPRNEPQLGDVERCFAREIVPRSYPPSNQVEFVVMAGDYWGRGYTFCVQRRK